MSVAGVDLGFSATREVRALGRALELIRARNDRTHEPEVPLAGAGSDR